MYNLYTTKNNLFSFHHQKKEDVMSLMFDVEDDGGAGGAVQRWRWGVCEVRNKYSAPSY